MKLLLSLLTGSAVLAGGVPNAATGECVIVDVVIEYADATLINPDPPAVGMRIYQACGYQTTSATGNVVNVDEMFWTDVDVEQAEVIVDAASDLLDGGDVYVP